MGVPSVFQTAPPQPASKARITCPPELAGGAEASQNGFGERMPPTLQDRSATVTSTQMTVDGPGGTLALGGGVDHFLAAVGAVARGEEPRAAGEAIGVDDDATALESHAGQGAEQLPELSLANGQKDELG